MPDHGTPIRLVAVDVDGTLLDRRHRVSAANAAAVVRAAAAGVRVVLVSARPPGALRVVLAALAGAGPPAEAGPVFVASQGALVGAYRDDGALVVRHRSPMPAASARAVLRAAPQGVAVNWYAGERWLVGALDALVEREAAITGCRPQVVDLRGERDDPDKLLLLAPPERTQLLDGLALPAGLVGVRSTPTHLEVTRDGVDKVRGLAWLCATLDVAPHEVAAIGDGGNDLPMLRFAGVAVAPANAVPDVLAQADLVVADHDHDAVAEALALLLRQ
ncbi:MAG: Cof-type HAD-IIB family hydrolase [Candidatus Nanopelagicales bacterium]|jgi:Cof subfamily protein (haloacid dehalogenase superfamily)|nr:Cof-type HAD-IIB family hydrolase [Candidatus Nanopelagicales bacterium]